MSIDIESKNIFKSITINIIYFYENLLQVKQIYFLKRYSVFKTLNIVRNIGVIMHSNKNKNLTAEV